MQERPGQSPKTYNRINRPGADDAVQVTDSSCTLTLIYGDVAVKDVGSDPVISFQRFIRDLKLMHY